MRVIIVDDQPIMRMGLRRACLEAQIQVVDEKLSIDEAVRKAAGDIIIWGCSQISTKDLQSLGSLTKDGFPVVVFTQETTTSLLVDCVTLGAQAVVGKKSEMERVIETLRAVERGQVVYDYEVVVGMANVLQRNHPRPDAVPLTPRQREVAAWVAEGLGNKAIGEKLGICEETVKNHLHDIFSKVNMENRTQLSAYVSARWAAFPKARDQKAA